MDNNQNNGFDFNNDPSPLYTQAASFTDEITPKKGFSIASLVLGIFGVLCCCFWPIGGTCAILALIFTLVSRKQNGSFNGLAIAGLVLAIIGIVLFGWMLVDEIMLMIDPSRAEENAQFWEEYFKMLEEFGQQPDAILRLLR